MFRLYSKGCEYAIRALVIASEDSGDGPQQRFQAKDVCEKAGVPESFTRKVLQMLVQEGLLKSDRGPGGGYALTSAADEISLLQIIRAVDGDAVSDECVMGLQECDPERACPMHDQWMEIKSPVLEQLEKCTLSDLLSVRSRLSPNKKGAR